MRFSQAVLDELHEWVEESGGDRVYMFVTNKKGTFHFTPDDCDLDIDQKSVLAGTVSILSSPQKVKENINEKE